MGILYITEFADPGFQGFSIAELPVLLDQTVTFTTSTAAAPFSQDTHYVRLNNDTTCSIVCALNSPVATTSNMRLPANTIEYFRVRPGFILAVITNT